MSHYPAADLNLIRNLATRCMELALSEEYERRRKRWRDANERRQGNRAPVWCRPAGVWREILPADSLQCTDSICRSVEYIFRQHLYKDWVGDDHIFESWWGVPAVFDCNQQYLWGMPTMVSTGSTTQGGFEYDKPVKTLMDYEKIQVPEFSYNPIATENALEMMGDLLGDCMPVQLTCAPPLAPFQGIYLEQLRGMGPMMEDMALHPEYVHRALAKLTEGVLGALRVAEKTGLLTLNHHEPMLCSDMLKGPVEAGKVGLKNLWTGSNSQEFDQVSPMMLDEFLLDYLKPVFHQFGAAWFGCCENLTRKIENVLRLPNLRIFVCSAWTDLDKVIEACTDRYTIMWRQSASAVIFAHDMTAIQEHLREGLQKLQGCHYQIILREVETLQGNPNRIKDWAQTAIEVAEEFSNA